MQQRQDRFSVKAFDCWPDGRIKPNALMQYMQEAAARHAEQLGFGLADLDKCSCLWVLANLRMEIARFPGWGDCVIITTWPSGSTRATASREFIGTGPDGAELFRAASEWMILDQHSGRPKSVTRLGLNLPQNGPSVLSSKPSRLQPLDQYTTVHSLRVPFSALDFNGHVNNTEYVRWALDGIYDNLGNLPGPRSLQVTYLAEVFARDEVEILVRDDGDGYVHALVRKAGPTPGANAFLMRIRR
jgi:medium-chain acyl-[acyl-carrier-protein] hydrolase